MTYNEADERIRALIDEDFLKRLVEIVRLYGWNGDYIEIVDFVEYLFDLAGLPKPDSTDPYEMEADPVDKSIKITYTNATKDE